MREENETKQAFACALKQLVAEKPFDRITVDDITAHAGRTRKAFYYHFYNKTQLLNWILRSEFVEPEIDVLARGGTEAFAAFARFLFENLDFYRKTPLIMVAKGYENYALNVVEALANISIEPIYRTSFPEYTRLLNVSNHAFAEAFRLVLLLEIEREQPSWEHAMDGLTHFGAAQVMAFRSILPLGEKDADGAGERGLAGEPLASSVDTFEEAKQRILAIPY